MDFSFIISALQPESAPPVPVSDEILKAEERRLGEGLKLPDQLRRFLQEVGPGDFHFGTVYSPVADDVCSSEMDREREDFRESQVSERMRSAHDYEIELLPFARNRLGTTYLFNLLDAREPNLLWTWESQAEDDLPTPAGETFWEFLGTDKTASARRLSAEAQALTGLALTRHQLRQAIREHRVVELRYRDEPSRLVHPGCLFLDKAGDEFLRAYQVAGFSQQAEHPTGWRSFHTELLGQLRLGGVFQFLPSRMAELEDWIEEHEIPNRTL